MGQGARVTPPAPSPGGGMGWVGPGRQGNGLLPFGGGWVGYQNTHPYGQSRFEGNLSEVTIAERQSCKM